MTIEKLDEHWYLKDGDFYLYTVEKSNACLKRNTEKTKDSKLNITMNSDYSVVAEFCEIGKKYSRTIGLNRNYVNCYSHKNYPIWFYKKILSTTTLDENDAFIEEKIKGSDDRVDVLVKRKFYNDSWNTWCMPFDMTLGELNALFGEGTKVYEFSSADGGSIVFTPVTTDVKAGMPYLVWPKNTVDNPKISSVTLDKNSTASTIPHSGVSFCGCYAPVFLKEDGSELFLNSKNKLSKPASGKNKIRGMRAFFRLHNDANVPSVTFNENVAGIKGTVVKRTSEDVVYTLTGKPLGISKKSLSNGMYIIKGKKILIKQ